MVAFRRQLAAVLVMDVVVTHPSESPVDDVARMQIPKALGYI